ncbi:alpha-1,6-mannosyltransferase [Quaeritorhiza haematococci]|nr:alpha-1,6-mannosyltransferase [Quaeritorhiza haematococci]
MGAILTLGLFLRMMYYDPSTVIVSADSPAQTFKYEDYDKHLQQYQQQSSSSLSSSPSPSSSSKQPLPSIAVVMISHEDVEDPSPSAHSTLYMQSVQNKRYYAKLHGYAFIMDTIIDFDRSPYWSKMITLHAAMHSMPWIKWFWWIDLDTLILQPQISLEELILNKYDKHPRGIEFIIPVDCQGPGNLNAGSFLLRNSRWAARFMRTVYEPSWAALNWNNPEQDTMKHFVMTDYAGYGSKTAIIPMRVFDSFPANTPYCNPKGYDHFREGDFVIHFAGAARRGTLEKEWSQFWDELKLRHPNLTNTIEDSY